MTHREGFELRVQELLEGQSPIRYTADLLRRTVDITQEVNEVSIKWAKGRSKVTFTYVLLHADHLYNGGHWACVGEVFHN